MQTHKEKFCTDMDIRYSVDTVVVGGGTAGCFAAISAARSGAGTLLIEKNGILGGTMTVGGVLFPGLFYAWGKQIIAGPCWESILRTVALGGAELPEITEKPQRHWQEQIRLNKAIYAYVLDQMCTTDGVTTLLHTMVGDVREDPMGLTVIACGKDGMFGIRAQNIIDATGDANVAAMMGYAFAISKVQQPGTITNRLTGYRFEDLDADMLKRELSKRIRTDIAYPEMTPENILSYLKEYRLNIHISCENGADSETRSRIEQQARGKLVELACFLTKLPGLEGMYIEDMCDECGIRETRRIIGEKTVTVEDYIRGRRYEDAVCYAFYPVDRHVMDGIEQTHLQEGIVPTIPLGALIPRGAKRVFVCGRSVSSDSLANSALRVQAPCMAMGQAAGCAAAWISRKNGTIAELNYGEVCRSLKGIGAIVP